MTSNWNKARVKTQSVGAFKFIGSRRRRPSVYLERELLNCPKKASFSLNEEKDPKRLVNIFAEEGMIDISLFLNHLEQSGLRTNKDPRLKGAVRKLEELISSNVDSKVPFVVFWELIQHEIELINRALSGNLIIPDFKSFKKQIEKSFYSAKIISDPQEGHDISRRNTSFSGEIDEARLDAWGVSICSVDGQRISLGDTQQQFALGSCANPILYALTEDEAGRDLVYKHVGREPSGLHSEDMELNDDGKPHNSMVAMGSIVVASLFRPDLSIPDRYDYLVHKCNTMLGEDSLEFNLSWYLKKKEHSFREFAIGHTLRDKNVFPDHAPPMEEVLDFYFQIQSLSVTTDSGSVVAATLANGGVCPLTQLTCLSSVSVRDTLSTMHSCGLYDYSGRWAFEVGLPAKSSSTGAIMIVVPNVMGICVWGPLLDCWGNSFRGIAFSKELARLFALHQYDTVSNMPKSKINPRGFMISDSEETDLFKLIFAAERGDTYLIRKYIQGGTDVDKFDYDSRTALHLAVCGGHISAVRILVEEFGAFLDPVDTHNNTPLDEAIGAGHDEIRDYLLSKSAGSGAEATVQIKFSI